MKGLDFGILRGGGLGDGRGLFFGHGRLSRGHRFTKLGYWLNGGIGANWDCRAEGGSRGGHEARGGGSKGGHCGIGVDLSCLL